MSFSVREGETFGLVGESGCGKTTIGRLVVALEKPTSGAIRFDGTDVTKLGHGDLRRSRRDFQIMFQDPYASLDPRMRVGTILREPLKVQSIGSRRGDTIRVRDAIEAAALAAQRERELASRKVIVEVDQLVKEFPVTAGAVLQRKVGSVKAVSNVSFSVREGETFGLVGESGCGKTTIGRLVVALEKPTSGAIRFDGTDVTKLHHGDLRRSRRDFQIMFQDPYASLDPRMRVGTILREPLKVQNIGSRPSSGTGWQACFARSAFRRRRSTSTLTSSRADSASASASRERSR